MTEHKFTDEEIMQYMLAYADRMCDRCLVKGSICCGSCFISRIKDGVDLINRQKGEINSLEDTLCGKLSASAAVAIADLKAKGEEMERELKAEAVKEFAERLKTYYRNLDKTAGALVEYHIDEIVKEMLEGG